MALSVGYSNSALLIPAGAVQSLCSTSSSEIGQSKSLRTSGVGLARWPSAANKESASAKSFFNLYPMDSVHGIQRSGISSSSKQEETVTMTDVLADFVADEVLSEREFEGDVPVAEGATPASTASQNFGKFRPRYPGPSSGRRDTTVPAEALRRGAVFKGFVRSIQPYGAFVNFGATADGLVHISKMSTGYVRNVSDIVALGQEVTVTILNVERSSGRIALSMVEKGERESRKPYVSSRQGESRAGGERTCLLTGSDRVALSMVEKEEGVSRTPYASSRPGKFGEGDERPRFQAGSGRMAYSNVTIEKQEIISRISYDSFRQRESGERGEGPRFQPGTSRRAFPIVEQEERMTGNPYVSPGQRVAREGAGSPGLPRNDGRFLSRGRITRVVSEAKREEQKKPNMKFVQIRSEEAAEGPTVEEKVSPRMRNWYVCECCW